MEEIILKFIIKIKTGNDEFFVSKDDLYNEWISIVKKIKTIETKYEECMN